MCHAPSTDKPHYRQQSYVATESPLTEQTPGSLYQHQETQKLIRSASRGRTTTKSKNVNALSNVLNNTMKNKSTQGSPTPRVAQRNRSAFINRNTGKPKFNAPRKAVNNANSTNTCATTDQERPRTAK
ncbi:hypothetical protein DPMN_025670 [Dreissena polymorpha]|uniref:Uncharacterized protein n=1 Tax=Dreissena polymorpha TaxID=45954 RepID=A0A9D4RDJ1_DREPO|nr:hypothetical protein DPMN_025670 [Dreissena polymorpha]